MKKINAITSKKKTTVGDLFGKLKFKRIIKEIMGEVDKELWGIER